MWSRKHKMIQNDCFVTKQLFKEKRLDTWVEKITQILIFKHGEVTCSHYCTP